MDLEYPGLPRAWRGEHVRAVTFDGPVAVIGDIHGRLDLLDALLARIGTLPIVVVGDVCDRGPDTRGVIDRLVARGAIGVMGNHDLWLAAWAADEGYDRLALGIGGEATLASYGVAVEDAGQPAQVPAPHRDWLLGLSVALDLTVCGTRWWVVHAGIPADMDLSGVAIDDVVPTLARERTADLLWRANDPESTVPLGRPLIMGHRPQWQPLDTGEVLAIDTGAGGRGGRLTALLLPSRKFVTVGP